MPTRRLRFLVPQAMSLTLLSRTALQSGPSPRFSSRLLCTTSSSLLKRLLDWLPHWPSRHRHQTRSLTCRRCLKHLRLRRLTRTSLPTFPRLPRRLPTRLTRDRCPLRHTTAFLLPLSTSDSASALLRSRLRDTLLLNLTHRAACTLLLLRQRAHQSLPLSPPPCNTLPLIEHLASLRTMRKPTCTTACRPLSLLLSSSTRPRATWDKPTLRL